MPFLAGGFSTGLLFWVEGFLLRKFSPWILTAVTHTFGMNNRGFSLTELIVSVILVGILSMGGVAVIGNMKKEATISLAIANAQAVNAAKQAYKNRIPGADDSNPLSPYKLQKSNSSTYFNSGDSATRFEKLREAGQLPQAPAYASFMPEGYVLVVGDLDETSRVTTADGRSVYPSRDPSL